MPLAAIVPTREFPARCSRSPFSGSESPMGPAGEHRRYRRLELSVPVLFTVKSKTGTGVTRSGVTGNVSPGGIYFRTSLGQDVDPRQELTIKLLIPRRSDPADATVSLSGEARVIRTERLARTANATAEGADYWGIAAQFTARPSVDLSTISNLFGTV